MTGVDSLSFRPDLRANPEGYHKEINEMLRTSICVTNVVAETLN